MFGFPLKSLSETFLILRRNERDVIENVYWSSRKIPVGSSLILMKLEFSRRFFKYTQISNFINISLVGVESFHADGRTDGHDEANSRSSKFCKCAKI